ncbi:MAG: LURP-one-related/scramblase family protein [Candidatus Nanohalobium sp.]
MTDALSRIDFPDNRYTVKQKAVRNAYKIYDSAGEEVLKTKQKMFKMKEEFPFTDPEGNAVFNVKAENVMDIAGDYAITDAGTGEKVAVLKKDFTFLVHSWRIHDADDNQVALIQSRGKLIGLLRAFSNIANMLPHKYTIEDAEGEQIGTIQGKFSLRDRYEIELEEGVENKEMILAAAITIDALEGN